MLKIQGVWNIFNDSSNEHVASDNEKQRTDQIIELLTIRGGHRELNIQDHSEVQKFFENVCDYWI